MSNDLIIEAGAALQQAAVMIDAAGQLLVAAGGATPPPVEPPPASHQLHLGTSVHRPPLSRTAAFREAQAVYEGRLEGWVTYENPAPLWDNCRAPANVQDFVQWSLHSIKPTMNNAAQARAQVTAHMESIPAALRPTTLLTVWHEPESKIPGTFSIAEWNDLQLHVALEGARLGILTAANLMEWTWRPESNRDVNAYRPGVEVHPIGSVDGYDNPGTRSYDEIFGKVWDTYASWGLERFYIREMGSHDPDPTAWWTDAVQRAYADGVEWFCPWDSPLDNNYAISDATRVAIADAVDAVNG